MSIDSISQSIRRFGNSNCKRLFRALYVLLSYIDAYLDSLDDWLDGAAGFEDEEPKPPRWETILLTLLSPFFLTFKILLGLIPHVLRSLFTYAILKQLIGFLSSLINDHLQLLLYCNDWLNNDFAIETLESEARWGIIQPILTAHVRTALTACLVALFFDLSTTSILESLILFAFQRAILELNQKIFDFILHNDTLEIHLWRRFSIPPKTQWKAEEVADITSMVFTFIFWVSRMFETLTGQMDKREYEWRLLRIWIMWVDFAKAYLPNLPLPFVQEDSPYANERSMFIMFCLGGLVVNRILIWWYYGGGIARYFGGFFVSR